MRTMKEGVVSGRRDAPLNRLTSKVEPADHFEPTLAEAEGDKELYRQLQRVMLRSERLWLLDVNGDYSIYRLRLRALAKDYKIPVPPDTKPKE